MSSTQDERHRFRQTALAFLSDLPSDGVSGANEQTRQGNEIVARWRKAGCALETLLPFLEDPDVGVRFAAASHLLDLDERAAVAALRELSEHPVGLVGPSAKLLLMSHDSTSGT